MKNPDVVIAQGKSISKTDKSLVESILGGEMRNAWQKGNGVDIRSDSGPYAKRGAWSNASNAQKYRNNYDNIDWR